VPRPAPRLVAGLHVAAAVLLLAVLLLAGVPALARPVPAQAGVGSSFPAAAGPTTADSEGLPDSEELPDPKELQAFFDRRVPQLLRDQGVPGAAVVVVAGGRQVLAEGYGHADLGRRRPVVPDRTAFAVASVSKTVTATAAMRLVEEGRLDLDADVNRYLDGFRVADTYPERPVTLAHLLTHTSGFEDDLVGMAALTPEDALPLAEYLATYQPRRVRPPGEVPAYSNGYGYALVGHLVEAASGVPFADYVSQRVLQPLGMDHTRFTQRPAAGTRLDAATPYVSGNREAPPLYMNPLPAGGAYATATDMGRFMLAHLGGGRLGDTRVLRPETVARMHQPRHWLHPRLPGVGYGLLEQVISGQRIIGHDGNTLGGHARFGLLPVHDAGIFVATNGDGSDTASRAPHDAVVEEFIARFYPGSPRQPVAGRPAADLDRFTGTYRTSGISTGDAMMLFIAFTNTVTVDTGPDDTLVTSEPAGARRWEAVGPLLFQAREGTQHLAFKQDAGGAVVALGIDSADPSVSYLRMPWYRSVQTHLVLVAASSVLLLTVLAWPVVALARRLRHRPPPSRPTRGQRIARLLAAATALLVLVFIGTLAYLVGAGDERQFRVILTDQAWPAVAPFLALITTAGMIGSAAAAWRARWWSTAGRWHYTTLTLAAVGFSAFVTHYNLAGSWLT
jgi:CubicO group peptidase (beta-lactamase class C family)